MDAEDASDDRDGYYETDPETGRIVEQYSDADFLDTVRELASDEFLPSTGDVADHLSCSRETARGRLKELAEDGCLRKLDSGAGFTWMPLKDESEET